jgi:hypothetical protein
MRWGGGGPVETYLDSRFWVKAITQSPLRSSLEVDLGTVKDPTPGILVDSYGPGRAMIL